MSENYGCCKQQKLKAQDYFYGTCCIPCVYGYGGYKSLKDISGEYGACIGSIVCLGGTLGASFCTPLMGCYVRVTKLDQRFPEAAILECCAPFTCAPCQMAFYGREGSELSMDTAELM